MSQNLAVFLHLLCTRTRVRSIMVLFKLSQGCCRPYFLAHHGAFFLEEASIMTEAWSKFDMIELITCFTLSSMLPWVFWSSTLRGWMCTVGKPLFVCTSMQSMFTTYLARIHETGSYLVVPVCFMNLVINLHNADHFFQAALQHQRGVLPNN